MDYNLDDYQMSVKQKTAPSKEPVDLEQAKAFVGLETDQSQFDGLLKTLLAAAVNYFENETSTVIMEQDWYGYLYDWPIEEEYIEVLKPPLISITSIKQTDSAGSQSEWAAGNYIVDSNIKPGRIYLGYFKNWPSTVLAPVSDAIEVEFKCGYEKVANVPNDIKDCIKLLVEFFFTNRGAEAGKMPESIKGMIRKHKIFYL